MCDALVAPHQAVAGSRLLADPDFIPLCLQLRPKNHICDLSVTSEEPRKVPRFERDETFRLPCGDKP
jgi:hypothetical protein